MLLQAQRTFLLVFMKHARKFMARRFFSSCVVINFSSSFHIKTVELSGMAGKRTKTNETCPLMNGNLHTKNTKVPCTHKQSFKLLNAIHNRTFICIKNIPISFLYCATWRNIWILNALTNIDFLACGFRVQFCFLIRFMLIKNYRFILDNLNSPFYNDNGSTNCLSMKDESDEIESIKNYQLQIITTYIMNIMNEKNAF